MSRRPGTLTAAALLSLVLPLTLAACGEREGADEVDADPTSSDGPAEAGAPCDVVTDARASDWAGTPQTVTGPTDQGLRTVCGTRVDPDDSLALEWSFQEPDRTLAELVEEESDGGLVQEPLDLGGTDAVLMTGEFAGLDLARVVTVVDAGLLVVNATNSGIGEPRPVDELVRIATDVASSYAG